MRLLQRPVTLRPCAWIAILGLLSGCATWAPSTVPAAISSSDQAETYRVTLGSGERVVVRNVEIAHDTLKGITTEPPVELRVIALDEIQKAELRRIDPVRSAIAAVAGGATAALALVYIFAATLYST